MPTSMSTDSISVITRSAGPAEPPELLEPQYSAEPPDPPRRSRPALSPRTAAVIVIVCVGALLGVSLYLYLDSPPAFLDLDVYREGVQAWWRGQNMYGTLPMTIDHSSLPFIYPPFALLFLGPLAALPWGLATLTMLAISLTSLVLVVHLSIRGIRPEASRLGRSTATAAVVAVALGTEPVWDTLWFGQVNLLLMALVTLDCLPARTRWPRGVLVGVAAAVKLTPAVFILYFLLRKDYRAAATAAAGAATATAVGFLVSPKGSMQYWFGHSGGARTVSGSAYFSNQTVDGFLARLNLPHLEQTALWLTAVGLILIVAAIGIRRAHESGNRVLAMSLTGCFGLIASPTSWGHHWVYIVPGAIAMGGYALERRSARWAVTCAVTVVIFIMGPYRYVPDVPWNWAQQIAGNGYVVVGITLLSLFAVTETGTETGTQTSTTTNHAATTPRLPRPRARSRCR
jgi:alpha-1,2-mannosyltransferase